MTLTRHRCRPTRMSLEALEPRFNPANVLPDLRVVTYNITAPGGSVSPQLGTILEGISEERFQGDLARPIDLIALQESSSSSDQAVANLLNGLTGTSSYRRGLLNGGTTGGGRVGVVYNGSTLQLLSETAVGSTSSSGPARQPVRYQFQVIGAPPSEQFFIYVSHYKAARDSASQNRRFVEADLIRNDADALPPDAKVFYAGDFNTYTSSEAGFQRLISAGNSQALDPARQIGSWSNNASFILVHSQAPSTTNGVGGGMDDRFDFVLHSAELEDGAGLDYLGGSYRVFGNNGTHPFNGDIDAPSNSVPLAGVDIDDDGDSDQADRQAVLDALAVATDHLPVVSDYVLGSGGVGNRNPAAADDAASSAGQTVTVPVLANDTDADGDSLTVALAFPAARGTVGFSPEYVIYTPEAGFQGVDQFDYVVEDGRGGSDTATVSVTVSVPNSPPVAADDSAATRGTAPVTVPVLANDADADGDGLTVFLAFPPANGTVEFTPESVIYTANAGFTGEDVFDYIVQDGRGGSDTATVRVSVTDPNGSPVVAPDSADTAQDEPVTIAVLANDSDPDGEELTLVSVTAPGLGLTEVAGDRVVYIPAPGFQGEETFTYRVADQKGATATGLVTVRVRDPGLRVSAALADAGGVRVFFNRPFEAEGLNLYGGTPDLILTGPAGPVAGSLGLGPDTLIFVPTGGPLAEADYSLTLRSAADGFRSTGGLLDGDRDGTPGGDYAETLTVGPAGAVVSLPEFARGPGQAATYDHAAGTGIPVRVSVPGRTVRSLSFGVAFDPSLLSFSGIIPGPDAPADAAVTFELTKDGEALVTVKSAAGFSGQGVLAYLNGAVPAGAPYGASQALLVLGAVADGAAAAGDSGFHLVSYAGDADGDRRYTPRDAALVGRGAMFPSYPLTDPVVAGDPGFRSLGAAAAAELRRAALGLLSSRLPAIPPASVPLPGSGSGAGPGSLIGLRRAVGSAAGSPLYSAGYDWDGDGDVDRDDLIAAIRRRLTA